MKYFFLALLFFCLYNVVQSQDIVVNNLRKETSKTVNKEADTTTWNWKKGGVFSFSLAQGSLSNWAAGGDNFTLAVNSFFNHYWLFQKDRHVWDNSVDINLGFVQTTSLGGRKNDDRLDFLSKYGYKMDTLGKWYLTGLLNFRSQFFDGYTYPNGVENFASTFLAPAYFITSVGFDYKPNPKLSVFISPATSRWVIVANKKLSNQRAYGVDSGKLSLNEIGAYASVNYANTIAPNITYRGRLDLFSNYKNNPQNIDFFMTNQFAFKINKFFSATYSLDLIYDDDVRLFGPVGKSAGLQMKSIIGIGYLRPIAVKKTVFKSKTTTL